MVLLDEIASVVGERGVLQGDDVRERAAGWRNPNRCVEARAIVRPASTEEVAAVLRLCHEVGQPVITHGGLTGLVSGTESRPDDLVLSLERMNRVEELDPAAGTLTVQAGVTLQAAQEAAEAADMMLPLDIGGRGSATIGGNIATNAGGNRVIRYGMTRDMVLGLEVVLADGRVMSSLNKIIKDNAGYNLKQLIVGSEGTLGIVTRAVLRLRPRPLSQQTAILGIERFAAMPDLLHEMNRRLGGAVTAFEAMWQSYYRLVTVDSARQPPVAPDYPFFVLIEAMGGDEVADQERFETALGSAYESGLIADAAVAQSQADRDAMWALRDDVGAMRREWGPALGFDISLPPRDMQPYLEQIDAPIKARWPERTLGVLGHLGDGNLHIIFAVGQVDDEITGFIEQTVYGALAGKGGSVSAEHGIGLDKKAYLSISRSDVEIDMMRRVKQAFDPKGILNPGKIF